MKKIFGVSVEFVILLGLLLLLAWIVAVPKFVNGRPAPLNSIFNNLRIIQGAKDQWALERKQPAGAVPTWSDLAPYLGNGKFPRYVLKEKYTINPVGIPPSALAPVKIGTYPAGSTITLD
jgi:hypothetical protein